MKKNLLCMLAASLIMPAAAQKKAFDFAQSEVIVLQKDAFDLETSGQKILPISPTVTLADVDGWKNFGISQSYDRQTQGSVYPMTQRHDNGFIGATWTNDDNANFEGSTTPKRGVGYSYSTDGGLTWSSQENRVGGIPLYWPSYAQWGENGEAILARSADTYVHNGIQILSGLVLLTRPNKGQGAWTITPVPYPAGISPNDGYIMTWARMATSGDNHQYIHIMSPMQTPTDGEPFQGYYTPTFYYRTQDGGSTWDIKSKLVPEMLGEQWDEHSIYSDAISFAVQGNTVACSFIHRANHGYVLKSQDNGDTWEGIKFFDSPIGYYIPFSQYADTVYIPNQGCIALDNNGKVHVAFSVVMAKNLEADGMFSLFVGLFSSFLSYWNEDMLPIDGDNDFINYEIEPLLDQYFDWEQSNGDELYVVSTFPKWPIIGYFTPVIYKPYYTISLELLEWAGRSYNYAGMFSFPQMAFDAENRLRLTYLGLMDHGMIYGHWLRHPFYTVTYDGGQTWTETEYLVNNINFIDREFAYPTLAGFAEDKMYMMAQVDIQPGTYITSGTPDHAPTNNYFYHFTVGGTVPPPPPPPPFCNSVTGATANIESDCKSAAITWTAVDGAEGYEIRRDRTLLGTVTTPSYTDNFNFVNGTTYKWKIKTVCDENISRVVSVSATADCEICDPVTNAKAEIENCKTATVTWDAVDGANEYEIRRDEILLGTVITPEFIETAEFEHGKSYTWTIKTICNKIESIGAFAVATSDCTGISDPANSVSIYPNPSNTSVTIVAKGFVKVEIYNTVGQLVETTTADIIDVSSYSSGIYFFKIYDINSNSVTKRIVVAR